MRRIDPARIKEFNETVGRLLYELRTNRGLTRRQVARAIKPLNVRAIRYFERGRSSMSACLFYEMVEFYGGNWLHVETLLFEASRRLKESSNPCPLLIPRTAPPLPKPLTFLLPSPNKQTPNSDSKPESLT